MGHDQLGDIIEETFEYRRFFCIFFFAVRLFKWTVISTSRFSPPPRVVSTPNLQNLIWQATIIIRLCAIFSFC